MGHIAMSTTDIYRLSDSCISTGDIQGDVGWDELPPEFKGVRGAVVLINVINCLAGKLKWRYFLGPSFLKPTILHTCMK